MKKLILSALVLFTTAAQANVCLQVTFKQDAEEIVTNEVTLNADNSSSLYTIDNETFKIVLTESTILDDQPVTHLDLYRIVNGAEELLAQPVLLGLPATLKLGEVVDGIERSISIKLTEVQ